MRSTLLALAAITLIGNMPANAQDTVYFDIQTSTGKDTLYFGVPSALIFSFDPNGVVVDGIVIPMEFASDPLNLMGVLSPSDFVVPSEIGTIYGLHHDPFLDYWDGTSSDTVLMFFLSGGGATQVESAEIFRIQFTPNAPGTFLCDSTTYPPNDHWTVTNDFGQKQLFEITGLGHEYTVVILNGDVTADGVINSVDILYLVRYCFKGGPPPIVCTATGDVNCTGAATSTDVIYLVNYVFKGGDPPCDITTLIPGTWTCP